MRMDNELTEVMHEQDKDGKMFSDCGATNTSQECADVWHARTTREYRFRICSDGVRY